MIVLLEMFVLLMDQVQTKAELKFVSIMHGLRFVDIHLTEKKPMLFVDN